MILVYCLLGLAGVGGLCWISLRIAARQQKLTAELTRLERLAAEVTLHAEAILERVDDRTDRLHKLLAAVESRAEALAEPAAQAAAPAVTETAPVPAMASPEAAAESPAPKKRGRRKKETQAAPTDPPAPEPATPLVTAEPAAPSVTSEPPPSGATSIQRYQALRNDVWKLADNGLDAGAIAQELNVPRGEIQLLLNLRSRKFTA